MVPVDCFGPAVALYRRRLRPLASAATLEQSPLRSATEIRQMLRDLAFVLRMTERVKQEMAATDAPLPAGAATDT